ncbi:MAG TPA: DUF1800 domain-containing protein [Anaerolineae bacterium]|nr:DUF1800 domain-containing protein [Anaerolineae bacterium]
MSEQTITRRSFLKTSAWASALFAATPFWATDLDQPMPAEYLSPVPLKTPIEWTTPADFAATDPAVLALNRIAFGPRPGDVERVQAMGIEAYIEQQLAPESLDDIHVDEMLRVFPSLTMDIPALIQNYAVPFMKSANGKGKNRMTAGGGLFGSPDDPTQMGGMPMMADYRLQGVLELVQATLLRQVYSERQLFELMVDFWTNHFNIYILKNQCRVLKTWDDREVIRKHALGKFRDLLMASAKSPAMLIFLDNVNNVKGVPQENYARELMELHTVGVDGGYTQSDVQNVARAFTGWSVEAPRRSVLGPDYAEAGSFLFRPRQHDNDAKTVLGMNLPAGLGIRDGEQVLEMLAKHPKTAQHISSKLVQRFVDDVPPPALVARAADTFLKTDGDIRAVMSTILHSDEFKTSFGKKVKRPLEFIASSLRALDASPTDVDLKKVALKGALGSKLQTRKRQPDEPIARTLRALGQVPFLWPAPNGYPDAAAAWVNTNNLLTRWNFSLALTSGRVLEFDAELAPAAQGATPDALVNEWSEKILHRALPDADRAKLIEYVRGDNSPDNGRVANLVALLLASPHFQYR